MFRANHVPIIRSWQLRDVIASCWYVPWLREGCQVRLAGSASMDALPANRSWQLQIWGNFLRRSFACGNLILLAPYFRLFQWGLNVPYRLAPRAAARLARHFVLPFISHLRMNRNWKYKYGLYGHERNNTVRQSAIGSCSNELHCVMHSDYTRWNTTHRPCGSREKVYK
jgi:hypothetical protein